MVSFQSDLNRGENVVTSLYARKEFETYLKWIKGEKVEKETESVRLLYVNDNLGDEYKKINVTEAGWVQSPEGSSDSTYKLTEKDILVKKLFDACYDESC